MWVILGILFLSSTLRSEVTRPSSRILHTETPEFQQIRAEGFDALYNMDYTLARSRFARLRQILPQHPSGYLYAATATWVELLNSRRRLQTGIYKGQSFFVESKEKVDLRTDEVFRAAIAQAICTADSALQRNPHDPEALYYKGAAHGLLACYEGTITRSFISALRHGSKSVSIHRQVIEIDPGFTDAYLTIGTYDYVVGNLPFFVKILAAIGGFHGSRDRGLEELKKVADHGLYANDDARVVLITFYARENRFSEALKLLEILTEKYPRNDLFRLERAGTLAGLGRRSESYSLYDQLLHENPASRMSDLIHFQYGETLAADGRSGEAIEQYRMIVRDSGSSQEMITRAHLRTGQLLDLQHRRDEAMNEYRAVLSRENVFNLHDQAKKCLEKPYNGQDR